MVLIISRGVSSLHYCTVVPAASTKKVTGPGVGVIWVGWGGVGREGVGEVVRCDYRVPGQLTMIRIAQSDNPPVPSLCLKLSPRLVFTHGNCQARPI